MKPKQDTKIEADKLVRDIKRAMRGESESSRTTKKPHRRNDEASMCVTQGGASTPWKRMRCSRGGFSFLYKEEILNEEKQRQASWHTKSKTPDNSWVETSTISGRSSLEIPIGSKTSGPNSGDDSFCRSLDKESVRVPAT